MSDLVGTHIVYIYANGWQYEMYVKRADAIDYRIHSGMVGGRWVKDQHVDLVDLDVDVHKISWTEPTGTSVCVTVMPRQRRLHGIIFFPRWVHEHPERTILFQNEHLTEMAAYRDEGPTYPIFVVGEFADILLLEDRGPGDESVIACAPGELPVDFLQQRT